MPHEEKSVVLLANDLMLGSTVAGFALADGLPFFNPSSMDEAVSLLTGRSSVLLLLDLETPGLNVFKFAESLSEDTLRSAVAYGPHVHTQRLDSARQAGFGSVLSRGQFSGQAGRLIKEWATD